MWIVLSEYHMFNAQAWYDYILHMCIDMAGAATFYTTLFYVLIHVSRYVLTEYALTYFHRSFYLISSSVSPSFSIPHIPNPPLLSIRPWRGVPKER